MTVNIIDVVKTNKFKVGRTVAAVAIGVAGQVLTKHEMTVDLMSRLLKRNLTTIRLGIFV